MRCAISALAALVLQCAGPLAPAAWAVDTEETPAASQADPDYVAGKKAVAAEDWNSAIALLSKAALRDDNNATSIAFSVSHTAMQAISSARSPNTTGR